MADTGPQGAARLVEEVASGRTGLRAADLAVEEAAASADASATLHMFEGFGIELEYALVDRDTLAVSPVCDRVLEALAGRPVAGVEDGAVAWSNELTAHVIEIKTNGPARALSEDLADEFLRSIRRVDAIAARFGARLMPTAMHPTMDPARDTVLWPAEGSPIYEAYDRVFDCSGHGWANLQSCHLNLPFCGADEFGRLHAAVRAVLPLLPAIAASSPFVEGAANGTLDRRLAVYRVNQRRIPSIIGSVVPEPVFTPEDYQREILAPMYRDIAPYDPQGTLQHEWLNSRGAIARFDRDAIEIRVLDVQETPLADLLVARLASAAIQALVEERWAPSADLRALDTRSLVDVFDRTTIAADETVLEEPALLAVLGYSRKRATAGELWSHLAETLLMPTLPAGSASHRGLSTLLDRGPLARRILSTVGPKPSRHALVDVYLALADCLIEGRLFDGA